MSDLVVPLNTVRLSDVRRVGGKAATLGALLDAGFPVPGGVCVTAEAYRLAFAGIEGAIQDALCAHDLGTTEGAEAAARAIAARTAQLMVPAPVGMALRSALTVAGSAPRAQEEIAPARSTGGAKNARLAAPRLLVPSVGVPARRTGTSMRRSTASECNDSAEVAWAVRSSATAEDGPRASYAGQYTTVLGVRTEDEILSAIVACWRSFWTAHALAARAAHGALDGDQVMGVLIQPMVEAECAGVCFSVDPVRQRRDLTVVHAAWGLGSGVVDGSVATDTAWVARARFAVQERRIVEQSEQIVLDPAGRVQRVPVPADHRRSACLPDPWLRRIAQVGVASEVLLGCAQDVEWAIAGGQVWVLQSRPITALSPEMATRPFPVVWAKEQDRRRRWTLELELSGREGAALLPLEIDYEAVRESIREEACLSMGADRNQTFQVHNGRIYITPLPFPLPESDRRVRRAAYQGLRARMWDEGRTAWDHWGPEIVRATERLGAFDLEGADGPQLADHLEETLAVRRRHSMLHPTMWFRPEQPFFDAYARVSGLSGQAAEEGAYGLLNGGETPLAELVDGLYELARLARATPAVAALVADPDADAHDDVMDRLQALPRAAAFNAALADLLSRHGERNGRGWGFEPTILAPTWREDPSQVLELIAAYLGAEIEPPAVVRARTRRARDAQVEALCAACPDEDAVRVFRGQLARARRTMLVLDYHNHYIDQLGFGQVRHAVIAAARWLVAQGALSALDDVFWLTFAEIGTALRGCPDASLEATIAARKEAHARWATLEAPPLLGVPEAVLPPRPSLQDDVTVREAAQDGTIAGQGASPGRVSGRARVVTDLVALPDLSPGEVLVAENVSPRWTPLLATVHALVLDAGGLGQHAAITAREYGVPAVIRTGDGTRRIPDGAWVTVDGTAGVVEIDTKTSHE